jgi:SlyX protein
MNNKDNNLSQEDRLIEIEMKLAYQEDLLQSLNDIIVEQRELLDLLELRMKKLIEQINNGSENIQSSENAGDELPPHY